MKNQAIDSIQVIQWLNDALVALNVRLMNGLEVVACNLRSDYHDRSTAAETTTTITTTKSTRETAENTAPNTGAESHYAREVESRARL